MRSKKIMPLNMFLLAIFLLGCSSDVQDIEFVESFTMNQPIKNFNIVLANKGPNAAEISFDITFDDSEAISYFGENYVLGEEVMNEMNPVTIESEQQKTFSVTFEEDFPDNLLEKMYSFSLRIYDENGDEKIIDVVEE